MSVLVPTFKLGINDAVLLAEGDYRNTTCLGLLVIKLQYPFKIFTACHNRIFMFCSAKVTWLMPYSSEAIVCLQWHFKATHTGRIVICILLPRVILWTMEEPPSWGAMTASNLICMFIPHTVPS